MKCVGPNKPFPELFKVILLFLTVIGVVIYGICVLPFVSPAH